MVTAEVHSILAWEPESRADLEYFSNIPWCAEVIDDTSVKPYRGDFPIRNARGMDPVIHGFMFRAGGVLRHSSLLLQPATADLDMLAPAPPHSSPKTLNGSSTLDTSPRHFPIHIDIFTLGEGLQGFPRTIYGGAITLLADGVCGKTAYMHRDPGRPGYTAYTNVKFLKPIRTSKEGSATILVRSQVSQRQSSDTKVIIIAKFEGPGGAIHAMAESLIIEGSVKENL